jgi:hypothetical protein
MDVNPLAQAEVEEQIMRLSHRLSEITQEVAAAGVKAAVAETTYKRKQSHTWLELRGHKGTVPEKEAEVMDRCGAEFEAMKVAEAIAKSSYEAGRNVRTQLEALRTIASNIRAAVAYPTGRGG